MKVHLSFDTEIWCGGWQDLDARFPVSFERYVYGHARQGGYALPKTLEILQRHGLQGVFFVEPLFSGRFGPQWLREIVQLLDAAGQDLQLHLHPEWTDEMREPPIADVARKRQHLIHYREDEQRALIAWGRNALETALGRPVTTFRAGSYAANADTYCALAALGLRIDSSLNACLRYDDGSIADAQFLAVQSEIDGVRQIPVTVFRDGRGQLRPAHVSGCGLTELRSALLQARAAGQAHFVLVSHNFELLKPGSVEVDRIVLRRFEGLCAFLAAEGFDVAPFTASDGLPAQQQDLRLPLLPTLRRLAEQAWRRIA
jgi:peptidoglycan/xylan/chitin deacetylase (PgdA/CDA1 family)